VRLFALHGSVLSKRKMKINYDEVLSSKESERERKQGESERDSEESAAKYTMFLLLLKLKSQLVSRRS